MFTLKIYHPVGMVEVVLQMNLDSCCLKRVLFWPFLEKMEIRMGSGGSILLSESGSNFLAIDTIERQHSFIWILPIMVAKITTAFGLGMILRN